MRKRATRRRKFRSKAFKQKVTTYALRGAVIGVIAAFILGFAVFAWFSRDLPEPGSITRSGGFSTVFLDRNDEVIFELFEDKNRIPVEIEKVPQNLKNAVIAVEDKNFYSHKGFSIWGIIRSVFRIATTGRLAGGSTLTQQLVKNTLLSQERTFTRKIKEVVLAVAIEQRFTKDEILEMYLNESPYGGTFWGVQSASKGYFDKDTEELTLVESAILAGLPQRPSVYSPLTGREGAYKGRTQDVLRRMREDKYITEEEEEAALEELETLTFEGDRLSIQAPHFVFYVRDLIAEEFGEKILDQGIRIKTTLDLEVQDAAEDVVFEEIEKIADFNATNGSAIILDVETGQILSMVGSYDYNDLDFGRFNTTTALRQPGSAVKPITYAAALEQGFTPSTLIMDVETEFPDQGDQSYTPVNYDGTFRGPVQYRFALANSLNIPAVKVLANVGIQNFLQTAYDMGLEAFEPTDANMKRFGLSLTLGGGETTLLDLTSAFSVFGRGGTKIEPTAILEIRDHKDKIIFEAKEPKETEAISEEVSFLISHILSDNNARADAFGTNSFLHIPGKTVGVKTGTTNDKRDNWTVGFTKEVAIGVWVGNNDNSPMNPEIASGLTGASPIWNRIMRTALQNYGDGIIDIPKNVEALQIDAFLGGLPRDGFPTRSEYFIKGTEPTDISSFYKKLRISKNSSDKLANQIEIKAGEYEEKDFIVITETDPVSTDGENRWQAGINEWASQQEDDKFRPPTEVSDAKGDDIVVSLKEPSDKSTVNSNSFKLKVKITSLHDIKKVEIQVNGSTIKSYEGDKTDIEEQLDLEDGTYEIKVRAENEKGKTQDNRIRIGVNMDWDAVDAAPTEEPTPTP